MWDNVQSSWYDRKINSSRVIQDPSALRLGPDHPVWAYFVIIRLTVPYPLFITFFTLSVSYSVYYNICIYTVYVPRLLSSWMV